jgi:guanosine-3',5'-bis(diphosphate) 3'-pyrophosphohydrolase
MKSQSPGPDPGTESFRKTGKMEKISEAIHFSTDAFDGKKRKCSRKPAVLHALEAAVIVSGMTDSCDVISAAVLHDVIEDAGVSCDELKERFGERTAELVMSETEDKRRNLPPAQTWRIRKEESVEFLRQTSDIEVKMVFLGDKLSNMRSIRNDLLQMGDAVWQNFNQKDPEQHHWYYRAIADAMPELKEYPAWKEYDSLIREVFGETERTGSADGGRKLEE